MGLSALTDRELEVVRARVAELVAGGKDLNTAARVALVEIGVHYWVKATLRGVIRSSEGNKHDTRAMRSFERALAEVNHIADPVRKLLAELGVSDPSELKSIVVANQQALRHLPEDLLELAAMSIDDAMKSDPDARGRFARRWGFDTGGRNGDGEGVQVP